MQDTEATPATGLRYVTTTGTRCLRQTLPKVYLHQTTHPKIRSCEQHPVFYIMISITTIFLLSSFFSSDTIS